MKCSICGSELQEVGYSDELGYQRYMCRNGCKFWNTLSWRLRVMAGDVTGLFFMLCLLVLSAPLWLPFRVYEVVSLRMRWLHRKFF
jgi:hypothetical protein